MGEIQKGILGGFSGTVGPVVGANWRGKDLIKSRPKKSNRQPSGRQMEQRVKFAAAMSFLSPLSGIQSLYFGNSSGYRSRVNMAASYLIREAMQMEDGIPVILFSKVLITKGELTGFQNLNVTLGADNALNFSWEDNSSQGKAAGDDVFCAAVYCEELKQFELLEGMAARTDGAGVCSVPTAFQGSRMHVYAWFYNAAGSAACNSVYLGSVTQS